MLSYLFKTTLCWSVFYLLYHLWLGKETFFKINRWYLLGTAILGALIPLIDFQWLVPVHEEPAIVHYMQPITLGMEQFESVIITASAEETGFDWWGILLAAYSLGAVIALARFLHGLFKIKHLYQVGEKSRLPKYSFINTPATHVPFSFFKNLFWSKQFEVDEEDRQAILRHEEAHIFQWHSADIILLEILGVLFWFNPFIYLYKKAIKTTHEYLADDYVVAQSGRKKYGQLLLRQSQSGMQIAISNSLFSSQLKNRIVMMTKNKSNKLASLKYLAVLPLMALLFLAFSFNHPDQMARINQEGNQETTSLLDTMPSGEVFKMVEEMPKFPGCAEITDQAEQKKCGDQKMLDFIFSNLKYPKEAREKGLEGMVVASFIIEKDGSISGAKIVRSIGGGCDEETLRVINAMPNWTPGKQGGKAVRVQFNLPIRFKLDANAPSNKEETKTTEGKSAADEVFKVVEEMPRFPGCEEITDAEKRNACAQTKMLEFVFSNIKYPKEAKEKGIQGTVVVKFIIEKDGSIADAEIARSIGGGCDEEVLKVVYLMPNWTPGKQGGKAVRTVFNLPVKFKLDEDSKKLNDEFEQIARFMACPGETDFERQQECSFKGLIDYISENLKYPELAKKKGIEGTVVIKFTVAADGTIQDAEIIKGIGGGCDEEALRLVKSMPNWIPGTKDGKPIATELKLPFNFALPQKDNEAKVEIFEVFPNPSQENGFTLKFKTKAGPVRLRVIDIDGRELSNLPFDNYDGSLQEARFDGLFQKNAKRGNVIVSLLDQNGKTLKSATVVLQ
ncbi:MAG: TonB family protein [Saprospiraceae bacterium]